MRTSLDQDLIILSPALQQRMRDGAHTVGVMVRRALECIEVDARAAGDELRRLGTREE